MSGLAEMEEQLRVALVRNDAGAVDGLMSDAAILIGVEGSMQGKHRGLLESLAEDLRFVRIDTLGRQLFEWGRVGVAIDTSQITVRYKGRAISAVYRNTRVWQRNAEDRWRMLIAHCSVVQSASSASPARSARAAK